MNLMKAKTATVAFTLALLAAGLLSAGMVMLTPRVRADNNAKPKTMTSNRGTDHSLNWVNKRVWEWQPSSEERSLDKIGWAHDIRAAERLAKKHGRPVFLFTHDGRMGIGRC